MNNDSNAWVDWWQTENITREVNWQKNMEIFIRGTDPILKYNTDDVLLDIGCGPGYLVGSLKDRVKEIHCIDISENYLERCRKKYLSEKNAFFYKLNQENYTDLTCLNGRKFSVIVCLSVIQYYKNKSEAENLIKEVRRVALPGARFLIGDIITNERTLSQIYGLLKTGIRENYLTESLKFLYRARFSDYHELHSSTALLSFSVEELYELTHRLGLDAEVLSTQITTNANRKHLLIHF